MAGLVRDLGVPTGEDIRRILSTLPHVITPRQNFDIKDPDTYPFPIHLAQ